MNIDKHLIIHLGQHKTGSTSIQNALINADTGASLYYPNLYRRGCCHGGLGDAFRVRSSNVHKILAPLLSEIESCGKDLVVLSSEFFSSLNELVCDEAALKRIWDGLAQLCRNFRSSEVIYYIREQSSAIKSRMQQAARSRVCLEDRSIDRFYQNRSLQYDVFDSMLRNHFSVDSIVPRIYSSGGLVDGDVCADFSVRLRGSMLATVRANKHSLSLYRFSKYLEINSTKLSIDEKMLLKERVSDDGRDVSSVISLALEESVVRKIRSFYEESNATFSSIYPELDRF